MHLSDSLILHTKKPTWLSPTNDDNDAILEVKYPRAFLLGDPGGKRNEYDDPEANKYTEELPDPSPQTHSLPHNPPKKAGPRIKDPEVW